MGLLDITPTSSTASSPRKSSTGLPSVPAAIFARRESGAGLPPPLRPRLPSSFRRPSFSTQSLHSTHSESPSDSLRSHLSSLRHVGEGALDDSDSDESGSDDEEGEGSDAGGFLLGTEDLEVVFEVVADPEGAVDGGTDEEPATGPAVDVVFLQFYNYPSREIAQRHT